MPRGFHRGHPMSFVRGAWRYDDGRLVSDDPCRRCGHCGLPNRKDGADACIGLLSGVANACCGHGRESAAYVQMTDGQRLGGVAALREAERRKVGK